MGQSPALRAAHGTGPLAQDVGNVLSRQPGDHSQVQELALCGTEARKGAPDLAVLLGPEQRVLWSVPLHVGEADIAAAPPAAPVMIGAQSPQDPEQPGIEADGLPTVTADPLHGAGHRLADQILGDVVPAVTGGVGPQPGVGMSVQHNPRLSLAASCPLHEAALLLRIHATPLYRCLGRGVTHESPVRPFGWRLAALEVGRGRH